MAVKKFSESVKRISLVSSHLLAGGRISRSSSASVCTEASFYECFCFYESFRKHHFISVLMQTVFKQNKPDDYIVMSSVHKVSCVSIHPPVNFPLLFSCLLELK